MSQSKPNCPEWAESFGFDEYGAYADKILDAVPDHQQRFRWCPPGEFVIFTEIGLQWRYTWFDDGFWLADSPLADSPLTSHSTSGRRPRIVNAFQRAVEVAKNFGCLVPHIEQLAYAACDFQNAVKWRRKDVFWDRNSTNGIIQSNYTSKPNKHGFYDLRGNVWEWGVIDRARETAMLCGGSCMTDIDLQGFHRRWTSVVPPDDPIGVRLLAPS